MCEHHHLSNNCRQLSTIGAQLIPVVSNPEFAMRGGGWVSRPPPPDNGKKRPVQLEKIAAQLSTIGAQLIPVVSNPKFSMAIFGRKGPAQLKIIAAQLEHNWLSLFWTPNPKWWGAGVGIRTSKMSIQLPSKRCAFPPYDSHSFLLTPISSSSSTNLSTSPGLIFEEVNIQTLSPKSKIPLSLGLLPIYPPLATKSPSLD